MKVLIGILAGTLLALPVAAVAAPHHLHPHVASATSDTCAGAYDHEAAGEAAYYAYYSSRSTVTHKPTFPQYWWTLTLATQQHWEAVAAAGITSACGS